MRIKEIAAKKGCVIGSILIFQAIVFIIATLMTTPYYETDDDNVMAAVTLGAFGKKDYHIVFANFILGKLIVILSNIVTSVNVYTLFQWIVLYVALGSLQYVLIENKGIITGYVLSSCLAMTFFFQSYHALQFTKTAGVATFAGLLLLVNYLEHNKKSYVSALLGCGMMLIGSMYRFQAFGMVYVLCFFYVLVLFVRHVQKKEIAIVKKYIGYFGVTVIIAVLLFSLDAIAYRQDVEWNNYLTYNNLRSELLDYGFPVYEENVQLYEELGYTEMDYLNFTAWDFADTERFQVNQMRQLIHSKEQRGAITEVTEKICDFFVIEDNVFIHHPFFIMILLAFVYAVFTKNKDKILIWATLIGAILTESVFICLGRTQQAYINTLWIMVVTVLLFVGDTYKSGVSKINPKKIPHILTMLILSFVAFISWFTERTEQKYMQNQNPDKEEVTQLIYSDNEKFYFSKVGYGVRTFTNIWEPVEVGCADNTSTLGDWLTGAPIVYEQWKKYEIENPYRALAEMENVCLVDEKTYYGKQQYILQNYNENAKMHLVKNIGGYKIWKFSDGDIQLDTKDCVTDTTELEYDMYLVEQDGQYLKGYMYEVDTNSFFQEFYLGIKSSGNEEYFYVPEQVRNTGADDLYAGKYAGFSFYNDGKIDFEQDEVYLYMRNENGLYRVKYTE